MFHRGAVSFLRQPGHGASTAPVRKMPWARPTADVVSLDHLEAHTAVLRVLIEDFGGEAVSSALRRRLAELVSWKQARSGLWLLGVLLDLERCRALMLEDGNGPDVIARILPDGVDLAYDPRSVSNPGQS